MSPEELAKKIDHTTLKPNVWIPDFKRLYREALKHSFRAVCVNQVALDRMEPETRKRLKANGIRIAVVVDFDLGHAGYSNKHFAVTNARDKGADEVDVVWNLGAFLRGDIDQILFELKPVARALPMKVIIEAGRILEEGYGPRKTKKLLRRAAEIVREAGAFCIKDHTGFGPMVPVGERPRYIEIWKEAEPELLVKSAGGIRTLRDAEFLLRQGADILGTSAGHIIVGEVMRSAKS